MSTLIARANAYAQKISTLSIFLVVSLFSFSQTTVTFNYTGGNQTWVVPPCVYSINVVVAGAEGGGASGGNGAVVTATLAVTPGQTLQIRVGGSGNCPTAGWNGGGNGQNANSVANRSCGGGGASDIRVTPYGLGNRLVVAGGGGGMGGGTTDAIGGNGGCASGINGNSPFGVGGYGASQSSGGNGGPPWISSGNAGQAGSLGQGGNGGTDPCYNNSPGGGGGGGYYGGGGGGSDCYSSAPYGGGSGGGGSSFTAGGGCTAGSNNGPGYVTITYTGGSAVATASNTGPYCSGQTIQLNSTGGGTYSWTGPNGFVSNQQNPSIPNSTTAMAGVYTVTVDNGGCVASQTTTVTINPTPDVNTISDQTVCSGSTVNAIAFTGSVAGTSYNWTNNNTGSGLAASGSGNIASYTSPVVATSQTSTITVTPTANSCTGSPTTFAITVNPMPTVDPTTDQTLCAGNMTTAVNFTGSVAGASYNWTNDNTVIGLGVNGTGNIASFTAQNPNSTAETATITATPTLGTCTGNPDSFTITVTPGPTVDPIADQTLCANLPTSAVNFTGNAAGTTFNWVNSNSSIGLATNGSGNIASFNANNTGSSQQLATITVTPSVGGCTGSAETFTITVDPVPDVNSVAAQTICAGDNTNAVNFTSSTAGATFAWTNSETGIGLAASGSGSIGAFSGTNAGGSPLTGTIIVTPNANGCSGPTGSFTITVNPLPAVTAGTDQTVCEGTSVTLNGGGASSYAWNNGGIDGVAFVQNPGTLTYTVTGADNNGCINTDQVDVTVNSLPPVNAGNDQTVCEGTAVTLSGSGAQSYSWTNGINDGIAFTPTAGTINYTVTGTDANGCVNTDVVSVTVIAAPAVYAGADDLVCEGTLVTLSGTGAQTYAWTNGVSDGVPFAQLPGSVTYTVTGTDVNGCTNTDDVTITVEALPAVAFYATALSGCDPLETILINTTPGNLANCIWTLGNGTSYNDCNPVTIIIENGGLYDLTLTTTSVNGCTNSDTYIDYIYVENLPNAEFSAESYELSALDPTVTFNNYSTGSVNYVWDFGDDSPNSTQVNPTHAYQDEVEQSYLVELIAYSPIGCTDTAYREVTVIEELIFYIPNTFTPDDDQFNQSFQPVFTSGHDAYNFNFLIFNRWGELIWESHDPEVGWDGTYGTSSRFGYVPDGVYTWRVDFKIRKNDERVEYSGNVNIIR